MICYVFRCAPEFRIRFVRKKTTASALERRCNTLIMLIERENRELENKMKAEIKEYPATEKRTLEYDDTPAIIPEKKMKY